jgi:hypothetical protein
VACIGQGARLPDKVKRLPDKVKRLPAYCEGTEFIEAICVGRRWPRVAPDQPLLTPMASRASRLQHGRGASSRRTAQVAPSSFARRAGAQNGPDS